MGQAIVVAVAQGFAQTSVALFVVQTLQVVLADGEARAAEARLTDTALLLKLTGQE